ncbi:hypothetical protein CDD83_5414 [Cordyceps sp. RAO-2017]|nr:hypothetical protein CDD83_5414 [Cordyceps sp. RAO-2017]
MASEQSSQRLSNLTSTKACFYDLLGVEPSATAHDVKRAYRKRALELHPDRNIRDVEAATAKFAEVQAAYDILSDPNERTWYDSHYDAIISGSGEPSHIRKPAIFRNVHLTTTEEIFHLMRKFSASVPVDNRPANFFGLANSTFNRLALEEKTATAELANVIIFEYPTFGLADDDYEGVVKYFYGVWEDFSTRKSFSWMDKHHPLEASDRRTRRILEKENGKRRAIAIHEFNAAVRFLVDFLRKRDPRCISNAKMDAEHRKSVLDAVAAQSARSRAANRKKLATSQGPHWAKPKEGEEAEEQLLFESSEESTVERSKCILCHKSFKSLNQLEAHERSKKHNKTVQELRQREGREGVKLRR